MNIFEKNRIEKRGEKKKKRSTIYCKNDMLEIVVFNDAI